MRSRRSFLRNILQAAGLASLGATLKPIDAQAQEGEWISVGDVEEFPIGVPKVLSEEGVIIIRSESDVRAMTLFCTHRGCPLGVEDDNTLACNCHGARFDQDGKVLKGPAKKPLPTVPVKVEGGEIQIFDVQR